MPRLSDISQGKLDDEGAHEMVLCSDSNVPCANISSKEGKEKGNVRMSHADQIFLGGVGVGTVGVRGGTWEVMCDLVVKRVIWDE